MTWLFISLTSYFILAFVLLVDKFLLTSSFSSPKAYAFYSSFFRVLAILLIPFVGFQIPSFPQILIAFLAGGFFVLGFFLFLKGLQSFDPSRIAPAVGGAVPIFIFLLVFVFSGGKEVLKLNDLAAFLLLIAGGFLITVRKSKFVSLGSLRISLPAAFFFAVSFVLSKYVYLTQTFWNGFILISFSGFLASLFFLFSKEVRDNLFRAGIPKKAFGVFFLNQAFGALAGTLQNFAIFLAPLALVAIINALQGAQYVFLLILVIFLSRKFPWIFKEEISKSVILQKAAAILLIGLGLVLLTLK